jgi:hypothetical protein
MDEGRHLTRCDHSEEGRTMGWLLLSGVIWIELLAIIALIVYWCWSVLATLRRIEHTLKSTRRG